MAGFLTALDMYICHPDVADNTKMFHHVLMWWSETSVHAVILYRRKKTLCPGVDPLGFIFWGALCASYTCVSVFFSGFGKFSAIISSNTFLIPFLILLLLGSLLHID